MGYKKGQSGNPKGRPRGSRNRLSPSSLFESIRYLEKRIEALENRGASNKPDVGFVYLAHQDNTPYYKIGVSNNVERRLASLQTSSPSKIVLIKSIRTDRYEHYEGELHERFAASRLNGEWFSFDRATLGSVIRAMDAITNSDPAITGTFR